MAIREIQTRQGFISTDAGDVLPDQNVGYGARLWKSYLSSDNLFEWNGEAWIGIGSTDEWDISDRPARDLGRVGIAEKTLVSVSSTCATAGDNELIAAPGVGNRIVLTFLQVQNESSTKTTAVVKGAASGFARAVLGGDASFARDYQVGREKKLAENAALNLNLSGANSHGYSVDYHIESI